MSFPYYAERSRLFLWLSCVMQSDTHPIFPSVNWHWWHSGQSAESQYQFSTSPGLWFFFFPPLLILPPLLEHRIVVTSPIAFAVDQLALKYLLITPLAQPPFLWCSQMGQLSFYEWAVETHLCFFFFGAAAPWAFPQNPHQKLSFTEKERRILRAIAALQCFLFPKALFIRRRAALPTASPTGEIFWGRSSITRAVLWMELWQGGRSVVGGAGRLIGPRCRQLYSAPGGLLSLSRTFTDGDKVQSSLVS